MPHTRAPPLALLFESAHFDRSCCFEISLLAAAASSLITHCRNLMLPVKLLQPSGLTSSHRHHSLAVPLSYMVGSPAALVPGCKTIHSLCGRSCGIFLSMFEMTAACKPLTKILLDNFFFWKQGGELARDGLLWLLIHPPCVYCTTHKSLFSIVIFLEPLTQLPPCGCATNMLFPQQCILGPLQFYHEKSHCLHSTTITACFGRWWWCGGGWDLSSRANSHSGHLVSLIQQHLPALWTFPSQSPKLECASCKCRHSFPIPWVQPCHPEACSKPFEWESLSKTLPWSRSDITSSLINHSR